MPRILIRAGKEPWVPVCPEDTLARNVLATNSGNAVFAYSAFRALSVDGSEVAAMGFCADPARAGEYNERYDTLVIPLANAFRRTFLKDLEPLTALIERLRIRVVVLGVGAQSSSGFDFDYLKPIEGPVRRFCAAVLERSSTIGVRGAFTAEYLKRLGFSAVDIIGCPSMFLHGGTLPVRRRVHALSATSPVAINISPYVEKMGAILAANRPRYRDLCYIPQDTPTLEMMLWGEVESPTALQLAERIPVHLTHRMFADDAVRFFIDPRTWMEFLARRDFSFGSRIHGNITALLAGTPCHVIAHDSRTRELAEYHGIPHSLLDETPAGIDPAELYARADLDLLHRRQGEGFASYVAFLERNGLEHSFRPGRSCAEFDRRMAAAVLPPAITPLTHADAWTLRARLGWLRAGHQALDDRVKAIEKKLKL